MAAGARARVCLRDRRDQVPGRPGRRRNGDQLPDDRVAGADQRCGLRFVRLDAADRQGTIMLPHYLQSISRSRRSSLSLSCRSCWYVLYKTPFGLRLRATGENPEAADAAGVNVITAALYCGRYLRRTCGRGRSVSFDRAIVAVYTKYDGGPRLYRSRGVDPAQSGGRCRCCSRVCSLASPRRLTIQMQGVIKMPSGEDIPVQFIQMIPYVLTIIVLADLSACRVPEGTGNPVQKGELTAA